MCLPTRSCGRRMPLDLLVLVGRQKERRSLYERLLSYSSHSTTDQ